MNPFVTVRRSLRALSRRTVPGVALLALVAAACSPPVPQGYNGVTPTVDTTEDEKPSTAKKKKKTSDSDVPSVGDMAPTTDDGPSPTGGSGGTAGTAGSGGTTTTNVEILAVAPVSSPAGAQDVTITVSGKNFDSGAVVKFGGGALATTFVSDTSLKAIVPTAKLSAPGTYPVVVTSKGADTAPIVFTVTASNAPVTLTSVTPSSALQGSGATNVTIAGTGFSGTPSVTFNGQPLTAVNVQSATSLTATIPATLLTTVGTFPIAVTANGAPSAPVTFRVDPKPVPTMTAISTTTATAGRGDLSVGVTGSNFTSDAKVAIVSSVTGTNGVVGTTTVQSTSQLTVLVPANHFAAAGTVQLRVYIPQPNNTAIYSPSSTWKSITVTAAGTAGTAGTSGTGGTKPTLTSVTVDAANGDESCTTDPCVGLGKDVTLTGSGFSSQNTIFLGALSSNRTAAIVTLSATRITFRAPTTIDVGDYRVYVCNPNQTDCARSADLLAIR